MRDSADQSTNLNTPGDRVAADDVAWFSVSSEAGAWGVARLNFAAYPVDALQPQAASLLVFGDVAVFRSPQLPQPAPMIQLAVSATAGANLRAEPSTDSAVIMTVPYNETLRALWRDGDWIRAYAKPSLTGWVNLSVVAGDLAQLPQSEPQHAGETLWLPWQRLDFRSGIDDAACPGASESGIILQTPPGSVALRFQLNGVDVQLSGTAFAQAQIEAGMRFHVLDGEATLQVGQDTATAGAGFGLQVPLSLDAAGNPAPADSPAPPSAYDYQRMMRLPIDALLYPAQVGMDAYTIITRRPNDGSDPLAGLTDDSACVISAPTLGANIRNAPALDAPVIATLGNRETAAPIARAFGSDDALWWQLAEHVWLRIDAAIFAGDCDAVPLITD